MRTTRLDAAEAAFFARELEHIYAQTYDIRYPELRAREFIPVSGEAGGGAMSVTYRQFDRRGNAKIISQNAKDVPRVDVLGAEFTRPVREVAAAYGWTLKELRSAAMANRPLNDMRAAAARRAVEEELDRIACFGDAAYGIVDGFLNNAAVPVNPATGDWQGLTADQIIGDVSAAVERIVNLTKGVEMPDTVLLPYAEWAFIASKPRSSVSDTTILEFILRSFPTITAIEPWYRLTTAGAGSATRMVVYKRAADKLTQEIASEFEQLPVQEEGLEFIVNTMASTAGTALYYPKSVDFTDGL